MDKPLKNIKPNKEFHRKGNEFQSDHLQKIITQLLLIRNHLFELHEIIFLFGQSKMCIKQLEAGRK